MALTKVKGSVWDSSDNGLAVNVKDFGAVGDGVTDDTAAIQAAFNALTEHTAIVFDGNQYSINGVISLNTNNITIVFQGTTFLVGDTGTSGSFDAGTGTVTGKIGFLFDQADNLTLLGEVTMLGQGTVGVTSLAGMVFSQCDSLSAQALMRFDTMAAGRFVINCDQPVLGDAIGNNIDGLQTFENPPTNTAGSVEVLVGCQSGKSGDVISNLGDKPARYMSVGFGRNNEEMVCGSSSIISSGTSMLAHALALRSAVNCSFGQVSASNGAIAGLFIENYPGDTAGGYTINDVYVESVVGVAGPTGASVDALVYAQTQDAAIGHIHIGSVLGDVGGEFGIYVSGVDLSIGTCVLSGAAQRLVGIRGSSTGNKGSLRVDHLVLQNHSGVEEPVTVGPNGKFICDFLDIRTGPFAAGVSMPVQYNAGFTLGGTYHDGIYINNILYKQNSSTYNYSYLVYDNTATAGLASVSVQNVISSDATTWDVFIGSHGYDVRSSRLLGAAAPASGTWSVGDQVWDVTPGTGTRMGWTCSVAGNPGTWLTMPSYA
jgi:hypothetical protein